MQRFPLQFIPLYDTITLGLFMDVGNAWRSAPVKASLFHAMSDFNPFSNAGVTFIIADGFFHLDFARQLKGGDNSWRITLRMLDKI
jgi:outer membrane protein assembly factor BamA